MQVTVSATSWCCEAGTKSPKSSRNAERDRGSDSDVHSRHSYRQRRPAVPAVSCIGQGAAFDSHLDETPSMCLCTKSVGVEVERRFGEEKQ